MKKITTQEDVQEAMNDLMQKVSELHAEIQELLTSNMAELYFDSGIVDAKKKKVSNYRIQLTALTAKQKALCPDYVIEHQIKTITGGAEIVVFGNYFEKEGERLYKEVKKNNSAPVWIHKEKVRA